MPSIENQIVAALARKKYQPVKPKQLARALGYGGESYDDFRKALKGLMKEGRIEIAKDLKVRPVQPHGTVAGIFRKAAAGFGFVRPHVIEGQAGPEIMIRADDTGDAATGDEVLVKITRKP